MEIKVIAIDADHTLYELDTKVAYEKFFSFLSHALNISRESIQETFEKILDEIKKSKEPEKRRREYCLELALKELNVKYTKEIVTDSLKIFWNEVIKSLVLKKGVLEFVEAYKKKYILGVFTDEFRKIVEPKLRKVFGNWENYFRFLITPEVTGEMKPSRKYYEAIIEQTNVLPEEIAVIGDSWERDLKLAKDMGFFTVLISEKKEGNPDIFVKDFEELMEKKVFK